MRILDRVTTTILLLLTAVILILWFRSHINADHYRWVHIEDLPGGGVDVRSKTIWTGEGGIAFTSARSATDDPHSARQLRARTERRLHFDPHRYQRISEPQYPLRAGSTQNILSPLGINYVVESRQVGFVQREGFQIALPLWMVCLAICGVPLARFIRGVIERERAELQRLGLCTRCGVSLRQSPARCPGCGRRNATILAKPTPKPTAA